MDIATKLFFVIIAVIAFSPAFAQTQIATAAVMLPTSLSGRGYGNSVLALAESIQSNIDLLSNN